MNIYNLFTGAAAANYNRLLYFLHKLNLYLTRACLTKECTMVVNNRDSEPEYFVVINEEEQYSIWATYKEIPKGWKSVGVKGSKSDCLAHIKSVWVDMRPLSARIVQIEHGL